MTHVQVEGAILFSLISIGDLRLASAIAWQELERHCVVFLTCESYFIRFHFVQLILDIERVLRARAFVTTLKIIHAVLMDKMSLALSL